MSTNKVNKKSDNRVAGFSHGECLIFQAEIPNDAEMVTTTSDKYIVALSEVTGNHHYIDLHPGVQVYKKDGKTFFRNQSDMEIKCVLTQRHHALVVPPGTWGLSTAQEYDYVREAKRNVAD